MFFGLKKSATKEIVELAAVFVLLGGLLGFIQEQELGLYTVLGAIAGGLLFALILSVGALCGMSGRKT